HLANAFYLVGDQQRARTAAGRGQGGFGAGVAAANNNDIKGIGITHAGCQNFFRRLILTVLSTDWKSALPLSVCRRSAASGCSGAPGGRRALARGSRRHARSRPLASRVTGWSAAGPAAIVLASVRPSRICNRRASW